MRRTAWTVPTPSKPSDRGDGAPSIESFQTPSADWLNASSMDGLNVYGRNWKSGETRDPSLATSIVARYCIGADACSSNQPSGNFTAESAGGGGGKVETIGTLGAVKLRRRLLSRCQTMRYAALQCMAMRQLLRIPSS